MAELTVLEPEPVGEGIVETLEEVLERAKAGEVSSVAIAYVLRDGAVCSTWSAPPCFGTLLGAVHRLAHRMNLTKDEG